MKDRGEAAAAFVGPGEAAVLDLGSRDGFLAGMLVSGDRAGDGAFIVGAALNFGRRIIPQ